MIWIMIVRSWRAFATRENAGAYVQHLRADMLPLLADIPGYRGIQILTRDSGAEVEVVVLTTWDSMDAIRRFAGDQPETAVVASAARTLLSRWDEQVCHYQVVSPQPGTRPTGSSGQRQG